MDKKDVLVGCAFNYSNKKLTVFLNSLNETGYKDDLILFINDKSEIISKEYSYNIITINPDAEFKKYKIFRKFIKVHWRLRKFGLKENKKLFFSNTLSALKKKEPLKKLIVAYFYFTHHIWTSRFFLYYYFLFNTSYDRIFFTDVRDVFFQKDPFTNINQDKIYVFAENSNVKLGDQSNNHRWMKGGFGDKVLEQLYNEPIYCAGTIAGSKKSIFQFLQEFLIRIIHNKHSSLLVGIDQATLNYMVSFDKLNYFLKVENGKLVFTVGTMPEEEIKISEESVYFTGNTTLPSVVHQYTKHEDLFGFLNRKFSN